MGRPQRTDIGGYVYHVLNRANARATIFSSDKEYEDFEKILFEAIEKFKMRIIAYTLNGSNSWTSKVLKKFGLEITERKRGRQKKGSWHLFLQRLCIGTKLLPNGKHRKVYEKNGMTSFARLCANEKISKEIKEKLKTEHEKLNPKILHDKLLKIKYDILQTNRHTTERS